MLVTFAIASFIMGAVYLIVRYGLYFCLYFSKKPLFSNELVDRKMTLSWKRMLGYALAGIGFGLGGMLFESFLLTVPSSEIRIAVFWGVPCIFSLKAVQVLSEKSELQPIE